MAHPVLTAENYGGASWPPPGRADRAERSMSIHPSRRERRGDVASSHKRKRQVMINFHRSIAGGFTVGILVMCVLAMSAPASARRWWRRWRWRWRRLAWFTRTGSSSASRFCGRLPSWPCSRKRLLYLPQTSHPGLRQYGWLSSRPGLQLGLEPVSNGPALVSLQSATRSRIWRYSRADSCHELVLAVLAR